MLGHGKNNRIFFHDDVSGALDHSAKSQKTKGKSRKLLFSERPGNGRLGDGVRSQCSELVVVVVDTTNTSKQVESDLRLSASGAGPRAQRPPARADTVICNVEAVPHYTRR